MDYSSRKPHWKLKNRPKLQQQAPNCKKQRFRGFLKHGAKREARGISKDLVVRGEMIHSDPHKQQVSQVGPRQEVRAPPASEQQTQGEVIHACPYGPCKSLRSRQGPEPRFRAPMTFSVHQVPAPALKEQPNKHPTWRPAAAGNQASKGQRPSF